MTFQLSPFLDESIEETTANIIKCDYCFPPEHWAGIAESVQQLIRGLLEPAPARRLLPRAALADPWFDEVLTLALPLACNSPAAARTNRILVLYRRRRLRFRPANSKRSWTGGGRPATATRCTRCARPTTPDAWILTSAKKAIRLHCSLTGSTEHVYGTCLTTSIVVIIRIFLCVKQCFYL